MRGGRPVTPGLQFAPGMTEPQRNSKLTIGDKVMADLAALKEQIVGLSLLEAAQLVKELEETLGVSAAAA
jgi:hypothetical protein